MRRLLALLVPLVVLAACGDDDAAVDDPTTTIADGTESTVEQDDAAEETADEDPTEGPSDATVPETTVPADAPAGDPPGGSAEDDEGLGDALLVSDLAGSAEVPGPGDPAATGRFEAELHDGVLCVDMAVSGLAAPVSGAHLHDGAAGAAGGVIVDIGAPTSTGDPVRWTDACTEVGDDVIERIAGGPERVYVNVHTAAHPDGAVCGQLSVASVFDRTLD